MTAPDDHIPAGWSAVMTGSHRARERLRTLGSMRGFEPVALMVWLDKPRKGTHWGPVHFQIIPTPMVAEATTIKSVKAWRIPAGRIARPWGGRD